MADWDGLDVGLVVSASQARQPVREGAIEGITFDMANVEQLCRAYLKVCQEHDIEPADPLEEAYEEMESEGG